MRGAGSKAGGPDYLLQFLEPRVVTECLTDIDGDLVGSLYSARAASAKIDACVR